jgi:hypothetical protein
LGTRTPPINEVCPLSPVLVYILKVMFIKLNVGFDYGVKV